MNELTMQKQVQVIVKGIGHLNGPVVINKTVIMDSTMASKFTGRDRHSVLEAFVNTHYPGVKVKPGAIGVNVSTVKVPKKKSETKPISEPSLDRPRSSKSTRGVTGGLILNNLLNKEREVPRETKKVDFQFEKEKLDLEFYKKQKQLEFDGQKARYKQIHKEQRIERAREEMESGGNKFVGYFKILWANLDSWWKKILFFYILIFIVAIIAEVLGIS